jgi:hypothetical protein
MKQAEYVNTEYQFRYFILDQHAYVKVRIGNVIFVLKYKIKHCAMKAFGGVEV